MIWLIVAIAMVGVWMFVVGVAIVLSGGKKSAGKDYYTFDEMLIEANKVRRDVMTFVGDRKSEAVRKGELAEVHAWGQVEYFLTVSNEERNPGGGYQSTTESSVRKVVRG